MAATATKLSEEEQKFIEYISEGREDEVKRLLSEGKLQVDCLDDHGMTPLQHAAYKANADLCRLLLAHGADVNSNQHEHGYTALMFAAISGDTKVTQLLLQAGAKTHTQNSVGRNAAQMAAFVGQHQCATAINNFFSREDLEYYCQPRGVETEPKLPQELAAPLYQMILMNNLHPVKLSLHLQDNPGLMKEALRIARLLDLLCEKVMKQSAVNEIMGIKFHYLAYLIRQADKASQETENVDQWVKSLVKGRDSDGFPVKQEQCLRAMMKDFPYMENQLILQLIRGVAPVAVGGDPTAMSVLTSGLNGQRFHEDDTCNTCGELKAVKKCSKCKMVRYCDQRCQKLHWPTHKKFCPKLAAEYKKQAVLREKREEEERKKKEQEEKQKQTESETMKTSEDDVKTGVEADDATQQSGPVTATESEQ